MLLTLKPTLQNGYSPHAYSPPAPSLSSSAFLASASLPLLPGSTSRKMSTPHRGLPPPSAMTLPTPDRIPPPSSLPMGALPAAPSQWQGADESMRNWLQAKSEEDRRKQEEERSRQESFRLETRKIEQTMLRESLAGGVPPYMVPMVFAGIGGANLANASLEWAQHYMAQIHLQQQQQQQQQAQLQQQQQHQQQQQQQQQQQHQQQQQQQQQSQPQVQNSSPEQRRDNRMIVGPQPNPYGPQQLQQALPAAPLQSGQQLPSQSQSSTSFASSYQPTLTAERTRTQPPTLQAAPPTSAPRPTQSATLPRLNTVEMQIQPPPTTGLTSLQLPGQHPLQQSQSSQQSEQQQSSPTLLFHHWIPPSTQAGGKDPPTPSGKSQHESPYSQNPGSHLRSEYTSSPKKRKATGVHQPAPAPTSNLPETSPSFSHTSSGSTSGRRRGHSRQRSDASSRAMQDQAATRHRQAERTESGRQSLSEAESGSQRHNSAQPETRQVQHHPAGSEMRPESRERESPKRESEAPS